MRNTSLVRTVCLALLLSVVALGVAPSAPGMRPLAASAGWTTYHQNNARTGQDTGSASMATYQSTTLSAPMDEKVQAEPLVYSGTVYAATENNTIYAFDELSLNLASTWSRHLAPQVAYNPYPQPFGCEGSHLGNGGVGITGTPVIDTAAGVIYAVALSPDASNSYGMRYELYGVSLSSHAVVSSTPITFADIDPRSAGQRGALALANGKIYIPFGGRDGDCEPYHPVVVSVPAGGGTPLEWNGQNPAYGSPCDVNNCQEAGIWASGGIAIDGAGNLLFATGNGPGGWNCALGWDKGDGVIKLDPNLNPTHYFAPSDWCNMHHSDQDMGSIAPVLLTPTSLLFQTAKTGQGWILDGNNLGDTASGSNGAHVPNCHTGDAAFGSSAWDGTKVYVPCDGVGIEALNVDTTNKSFSSAWSASGFSPGPPIVAGGYVWATDQGGGTLHRMNVASGTDTTFPMGSAGRFNTPAADSNRIFVAQNSPSGIREFNFAAPAPAFTAMFPWFDRISSPGFKNDNIHVVNPGVAPVTISLDIPGQPGCAIQDTIGGGAAGQYTCPTGFGGPVVLQASARVDASQRVQYYQSFNEVAAEATSAAATTLFFPWYDLVSSPGFLSDNIHVVVPGATGANVQVTIPGCGTQTHDIYAGTESVFSCSSGFGGPVAVNSAVPVLASQRVQYYQSFNEVAAQPVAAAGTRLYFPWYDRISSPGFQNDNVHVVNPGTSVANVTVNIPGCGPQTSNVGAFGEVLVNCPSGFGGPVSITSNNAVSVLASQRVQYYQSFNEVTAQGPANAATKVWFSWFDRISDAGFQGDNVHVVNPGGSPANLSVSIPGCSTQAGTAQPGGELLFTCASGFGGPVEVVAVGSSVLASQRVQYYQSFNEVSGQP